MSTQGYAYEHVSSDIVERVITVDEVEHCKPHAEVYGHCARSAGVDPPALALVAAHGWDIHGAGCAGLITAYMARKGEPFPATMRAPDVTGASLSEVVRKLLESPLPAGTGAGASDDDADWSCGSWIGPRSTSCGLPGAGARHAHHPRSRTR